jgi:hypothetical protein
MPTLRHLRDSSPASGCCSPTQPPRSPRGSRTASNTSTAGSR